MSDPMEWANVLHWVDVPVAADGGEDYVASPSTLRAYVGWDIQADRATPVSVLIRNVDGTAVTPAQWRKVKTSEIIAASRLVLVLAGHYLPALALLAGESVTADDQRAADRIAAAVPEDDERSPRTVYTSEHYHRVAEIYNAAVRAADPQPVQTVRRIMRDELRLAELPETTVRGWIRTAKARGHITTRARKPRQ